MLPVFSVRVAHTDGTEGAYEVTPFVIDEFEEMFKVPFMRTFSDMETVHNRYLNYLAFLAEREAGVAVAAWKRDYTISLRSIPALELLNPPSPAGMTDREGTSAG